jgi:hypothetical protein
MPRISSLATAMDDTAEQAMFLPLITESSRALRDLGVETI